MRIFEKPGAVNTDETLTLAIETAKERGLPLVVATSKGNTARRAVELARQMQYTGQIVAVTCANGHPKENENGVSQETRTLLADAGVTVVTAAHALSGAERGLSKVFGGVYPVEIMAATLRMFGQGTKVCVEIALMAADNGSIAFKKPVVVVGGSGGGADTACIITPSYTARLLETRVNEMLCKPSMME